MHKLESEGLSTRSRSVRLGDVVENVNDYFVKGSEGAIRYVAGEHIDEGDLRVRRSGMTSDDLVPPTFNRLFRAGDVLFHSRNIRKLAQPDFGGLTGEKLFVLRTKNPGQLSQAFLPLLLQSERFRNYVEERWAGSTNKFLNKTPLMAYEFALPPMEEQERLIERLTAISDLMESYRALEKASEQVLKAELEELLHQDLIRPLHEGREIQVPTGWRTVALGDVLTRITYGFTNPMPTTDDGPWMVTAKDVFDGRINFATARRTTRTAFNELLTDKSRPRVGDVLVTKDGTLGRVGVVESEDICINQSVALLQPNALIRSRFLAWTLRAPAMQRRLLQDAGGSAIKHLYITKMAETEFVLPPPEVQDDLLRIIDPSALAVQQIGLRRRTLSRQLGMLLNTMEDADGVQ